jgi:hypothetical protein
MMGFAWSGLEMTMSTITKEPTATSLRTYFVDLFKVDADQFQMVPQKRYGDRDCECLNRPYELSDLMRQATAAGVWPRSYCRPRVDRLVPNANCDLQAFRE